MKLFFSALCFLMLTKTVVLAQNPCNDFSLNTSNFSLDIDNSDSITLSVDFSGQVLGGVVNPVIDIDVSSSPYLSFPNLPLTIPVILSSTNDNIIINVPVDILAGAPNGLAVQGDFHIYKPLPNPPFFDFACVFPVNFTLNNSPNSVDPDQNTSLFSLYPNPARDFLMVAGDQLKTLQVHDLSGKTFNLSWEMQGDNYYLDLNSLPKGYFLVTIINEEGKQATRHFIRQ